MNLMQRIFGAPGIREEIRPAGIFPGAAGRRRADIIRWWTYYHGADPVTGRTQWDFLYDRFETMPRRELPDVENHTRICVDRLRRLLVNSWRGFEFGDAASGAAVRGVFERNRWPHLLNLAALYGKVTGDVFIKLMPAPPESPFGPVRLILLDTEAVEVETDPHDRDDITAVIIDYDFFTGDGPLRERHHFREELDRGSVHAFLDGEHLPECSGAHGLGFVPVVHIRNLDTGGDVYGESLVSRLVDAQDALNLLSTDLMDIVRYDGHKTTIFQNVAIDRAASRDGQTAGEIDLSIGKGLVVRGEGKVYKLDQQHDLGAALEEYDRKLDAFYALAGVPRIGGEMVSRLGNLSGRAIERLYQDAIESTREAQEMYGESFRELADKTAAMLGFPPPGARALWNTDVIAPDIDTLGKEYGIGARSLRSVMRKLGIVDTGEMLREIREEKEGTSGGGADGGAGAGSDGGPAGGTGSGPAVSGGRGNPDGDKSAPVPSPETFSPEQSGEAGSDGNAAGNGSAAVLR